MSGRRGQGSGVSSWHIAGPYFESCNCDPICPCRSVDSRPGSAIELCQFALAWTVRQGHFDETDLAGVQAVMVGYWDASGLDWSWTVGVFVDDTASDDQRRALGGILTGRHGGTPGRQYAPAIATVAFEEPAGIVLDHTPGAQSIRVRGHVDAQARQRYESDARISCGIPGHDRPGYEVVMEGLNVHTTGMEFSYQGNCGFASTYDYRSDAES
ncbi:MAG TPA: DUF1326 domain-containing protein [Acidimicrobiales bacterium]|nr:DUF1326 domain-containing protein [Acidimicrobiales bacterium]